MEPCALQPWGERLHYQPREGIINEPTVRLVRVNISRWVDPSTSSPRPRTRCRTRLGSARLSWPGTTAHRALEIQFSVSCGPR